MLTFALCCGTLKVKVDNMTKDELKKIDERLKSEFGMSYTTARKEAEELLKACEFYMDAYFAELAKTRQLEERGDIITNE